MINELSIQSVQASQFSKSFKKPLYDSFCFSKIAATVSALLTGKGKEKALQASCYLADDSYDVVFLLLLDGLGWRFFERYMDHPFCKRFIDSGIVSKLTSQFPSTTSAELTTIHTGMEVGQTGIYEWFQYEPKVDRMISPLLFSYAGDSISEALIATGIPPKEFFPFHTIYEQLHAEKVTSYLFQPAGICNSAYSQSVGRGAHFISYQNLKQGLSGAVELLQEKQGKNYLFFYFPDIDSVGHRQGIEAKQLEDTILMCLDLLEKELIEKLSFCGRKTALLLTSDHGMVSVSPRKTIYINNDLPQITSFLKTNKKGDLLMPAGSCRDFFLHIQDEKLEETKSLLSSFFEKSAEVWKVSDLIDQGLFGKTPLSSRFLERVGNLVILPLEEECVWWYQKNKFEQHFYGAHGGLTSGEVEIPFLFLPL